MYLSQLGHLVGLPHFLIRVLTALIQLIKTCLDFLRFTNTVFFQRRQIQYYLFTQIHKKCGCMLKCEDMMLTGDALLSVNEITIQ